RLDRQQRNPNALAAVRRGPREGTLLDITTDAAFVSLLLAKLRASETIELEGKAIEFRPAGEIPPTGPAGHPPVPAVDTEQSNTTVLVGTDYVLKLFRRIEAGINPEIEIGRFLTDMVAFQHMPPLIGSVELVEGQARSALAVVHRFIDNQGDAWSVTN